LINILSGKEVVSFLEKGGENGRRAIIPNRVRKGRFKKGGSK